MFKGLYGARVVTAVNMKKIAQYDQTERFPRIEFASMKIRLSELKSFPCALIGIKAFCRLNHLGQLAQDRVTLCFRTDQ